MSYSNGADVLESEMGREYGYMEVVGAKIRQKRVALNISQEALGRSVGLEGSAISRIENGRRESLDLNTVKRIAAALSVDINSLV